MLASWRGHNRGVYFNLNLTAPSSVTTGHINQTSDVVGALTLNILPQASQYEQRILYRSFKIIFQCLIFSNQVQSTCQRRRTIYLKLHKQ